jgi:hypothetical protein
MIGDCPTFLDLIMQHRGDREVAENVVLEHVYFGESLEE